MNDKYSDPIQVIRRQKRSNMATQFFTPPIYTEETENVSERRRVAGLLHTILLIMIPGTLLGYLAMINHQRPLAVASAISVVLLIEMAAFTLLRLHREKLAGLVLVIGLWVGFIGLGLLSEGIANSATFGLILVVTIAGLALGGRAGLVFAGLSGLAVLLMLAIKQAGLIPAGLIPFEPFSFAFLVTVILLAIAGMIQLATSGFREATQLAMENERAQVKANQELQAVRSMLEELVKARTEELQTRSKYLQATIEISRVATSMLEPEQLMRDAVNLIGSQFDLYYVGMFLLDASGEWAVLRAGTGSAGKSMIARGHRIRYGTGMVGWSIANAQPRIAAEIGRDAVRLATAELPDTRSEAAFPLRARAKVIGAMTVQSVRPEAFGETEISTFQALADQIAIALENARLFSEGQEALLEAQQATRHLTGESWQAYMKSGINLKFRYDHGQITAISDSIEGGNRQPAEFSKPITGNLGKILVLPIAVRGQEIGKVRFVKGHAEEVWSDDEVALLTTVVEQLGIAMDSARLYEETRRRAERERMTGEIITKIRSTNDPQTILETAVVELRKALQADRAQQQLKTLEKTSKHEARNALSVEIRTVLKMFNVDSNGDKWMDESENYDSEWAFDSQSQTGRETRQTITGNELDEAQAGKTARSSIHPSSKEPVKDPTLRHPLVVAIANQKGGVAKTTTVVSLGGALANYNKEVLLVDLDAQANLTLSLGKDPGRVRGSITDVLFHSSTLLSVSRETSIPGLDLVPSNSGMDLAERFLPVRKDYEKILRRVINEELRPGLANQKTGGEAVSGSFERNFPIIEYDFVILDCPPILGAVTLNALVAADVLIIPTQPEFFSAHALRTMMTTVRQIRQQQNADLIYRILITMLDKRNRIHRQIHDQIYKTFGEGVFQTIIEVDTKLRESAIEGKPIMYHKAHTRSALQYDALAQEIMQYVR